MARFNEENPEIRDRIGRAAQHFRGNARELKRFVNAFRFQYCLWWARRARGLAAPSIDQLFRWAILSMKWPEVVRWLRRGDGSEWQDAAGAVAPRLSERYLFDQVKAPAHPSPPAAAKPLAISRLTLLQEISGRSSSLDSWQKAALTRLHLAAETTSWLRDDELHRFFQEEWAHPESERLSAGLGMGLW